MKQTTAARAPQSLPLPRWFESGTVFHPLVDTGPGSMVHMAQGIDDLHILRMVVDILLGRRKRKALGKEWQIVAESTLSANTFALASEQVRTQHQQQQEKRASSH